MKAHHAILVIAGLCLCLAGGFWAGKQTRLTIQANRSANTHLETSGQETALPEQALQAALASSVPNDPLTYPLPSGKQPDPEGDSIPAATLVPPATQLAQTATPPAEPTATLPPEPSATTASPTAAAPLVEPQPAGSQRNILIINVDDLHAKTARLQSVWLALYVTGTPHFTLMPVFPQIVPQDIPSPATPDPLAQVFSLNEAGEPSAEFLQALEERGAWWNATILLDQTVIANIIGVAYKGEHLPDLEAIQAVLSPDPGSSQEIIFGQAWLGQQLCQNLVDPAIDETPQLLNLLTLIPAHLRTDMDLQQARGELESILMNRSQVVCEIPVLSGGGVEP